MDAAARPIMTLGGRSLFSALRTAQPPSGKATRFLLLRRCRQRLYGTLRLAVGSAACDAAWAAAAKRYAASVAMPKHDTLLINKGKNGMNRCRKERTRQQAAKICRFVRRCVTGVGAGGALRGLGVQAAFLFSLRGSGRFSGCLKNCYDTVNFSPCSVRQM